MNHPTIHGIFLALDTTNLSSSDNSSIPKIAIMSCKDLSSATASRDLKKGVELHFFEVLGNKNQTKYRVL